MPLIELFHTFAVFALFGLIWTIQLVHYPAFHLIELREWPAFHRFHSIRITFIVLPLMLIELITALKLFLDENQPSQIFFLSCAVLTWVLTILVFMPLHHQITNRPQSRLLSRLVALNWLRVAIWTFAAGGTFFFSIK
jgi:hypothetical protein